MNRDISPQYINTLLFDRLELSIQEKKIIKDFQDFFYCKHNYQILVQFINNHNNISLRVIDYFLTNYCLINRVFINDIDVYQSYKLQLHIFHKKFFDPCSRGLRIPFFYNNDKCILTTVCQLNFFKWFIKNNIYLYVLDNYKIIKTHMKNNKHKNKSTYFKDNIISKKITKNNISISFD